MRKWIALFETSYETYTQDDFHQVVATNSCVTPAPREAEFPKEAYHWTYEPNYPLDRLGDYWEEWWEEELKMWADEGQPDRYDDELKNEIREPIIAVEVDGKGYIWDGCHRTAASIVTGRKTIPAFIGRIKDQP
jgi:hypothetical protein